MGFADIAGQIGSMRLKTKMLILMAVALIGFLFIVITALLVVNRVGMDGTGYRRITSAQNSLDKAALLQNMLYRLQAMELDLTCGAGRPAPGNDPDELEAFAARITAALPPIQDGLRQTAAREGFLAAQKTWLNLSNKLNKEILPAVRQGDQARARELSGTVQARRYREVTNDLAGIIESLKGDISAIKTEEAAYARRTALIGLILGGGMLFLVCLFGWIVIKSLVSSVSREAAFTRSLITGGDLSLRLATDSRDEIGELGESLNSLVDLLSEMVTRVDASSMELAKISHTLSDASKQVFRGAEQTNTRVGETSSAIIEINASIKEVSQGIDSLSLSASENSSSVLEMAASVEEVALNVENLAQSVDDVSSSIIEMAAAIKHISDSVNGLIDSSTVTASSVIQMDSSIRQVEKNALDTAAISEQVRKDAETGRASVEATITGMQEIKRSSHITHEVIETLSQKAGDIGTILSVINEVAEQTNLLALNAAIIAAQAGEQGKGFAVVADEIKELADRTSSSTREIEELIKGVQEETDRAVDAIEAAEKRIADGELLSQKSGVVLEKIVAGVEKASVQVGEIAGAAAEQARGSQMIRDAMERVTDMIMQIANATQQQNKGSDLIMTAVERMKILTSQVRSSIREQSKVGNLIAASTENITTMIRQIKRACDEQTRGSEQIVTAVDDIQKSSHDHLQAAGTMERAVGGLSRQVDVLKKEISGFTLKEDHESTGGRETER